MRNQQRGLSFVVFLIGGIFLAILALAGMKIGPAFGEFSTAKKAINAIAASEGRTGSVMEIRKAFDRRAGVDSITVISSNDLDISKDGGDVVISFAYSQKIPLFANVSLLVDFSASTAPGGGADKQ